MTDSHARTHRPLLSFWWFVAMGVLLIGNAAIAEPGEFDSPDVMPMSAGQRERLAELARTHPDAGMLVMDAVAASTDLLDDPSRPLVEIHYEGLVNTHPARIATVEKLNQMRDLALVLRAWQATASPAAAETLRTWVHAWATTYIITGNDVNENKFQPLLIAYESLRETFPAEERLVIDRWVRLLGETHRRQLLDAEPLGNRYAKHLRIVCLCAKALGEDAWLKDVRKGAMRLIEAGLNADGTSRDLLTRDSLTYHASTLKPLIELSILLPHEQEASLYDWESSRGSSVRKSVGYILPYAKGEKTHEEWRDSTVDLDRRRADAGISKYQPGTLYEPRQAASVLALATYHQPELLPLVRRISGGSDMRYPTWQCLINEAMRPPTGK